MAFHLHLFHVVVAAVQRDVDWRQCSECGFYGFLTPVFIYHARADALGHPCGKCLPFYAAVCPSGHGPGVVGQFFAAVGGESEPCFRQFALSKRHTEGHVAMPFAAYPFQGDRVGIGVVACVAESAHLHMRRGCPQSEVPVGQWVWVEVVGHEFTVDVASCMSVELFEFDVIPAVGLEQVMFVGEFFQYGGSEVCLFHSALVAVVSTHAGGGIAVAS